MSLPLANEKQLWTENLKSHVHWISSAGHLVLPDFIKAFVCCLFLHVKRLRMAHYQHEAKISTEQKLMKKTTKQQLSSLCSGPPNRASARNVNLLQRPSWTTLLCSVAWKTMKVSALLQPFSTRRVLPSRMPIQGWQVIILGGLNVYSVKTSSTVPGNLDNLWSWFKWGRSQLYTSVNGCVPVLCISWSVWVVFKHTLT